MRIDRNTPSFTLLMWCCLFLATTIQTGCVLDISSKNPPNSENMVSITKKNGQKFFMDIYEYPNKKGKIPMATLDYATATKLCSDQGKRLCTMEEWKTACGSRKFVYGDTYIRNKCYSNQNNTKGHTSLMHGETAQVASGSHPDCKSPAGVYDLLGNVEEWVLDDWRGFPGNLAGGAWYSNWKYADCTAVYSKQPDYRLSTDRPVDSAGVRCCWSSWTPTQEDIRADAVVWLESVQTDQMEYNTVDEIEISEGIWIDTYEYPNRFGATPLVAVTWDQAFELCKENNKILCTREIWESACASTEQWNYPYGTRYKPNVCNTSTATIATSGSFADCKSPLGIADLTGNVWEWIDAELDVPELQTTPSTTSLKEIRGGSWLSDDIKSRCVPTIGYPVTDASQRFPDVGFRCCRQNTSTPKPSTTSAHIHENMHSCPTDMIPILQGCIDKYEYPNVQGTIPYSEKNLQEAKQICQTLGKHLCSSTEWQQACQLSVQDDAQSTPKRRWSYGIEHQIERCHQNSQQGGAIASGQKPDCHTPDGIFDMTGNLWEWTSDGAIQGGNWNFSEGLGQCTAPAFPQATESNTQIGFRCCASLSETDLLLPPP